MSDFVKRVPNILTLLRVALIPFFVFLMECGDAASIQWALIIFIIAGVTDFADGVIARKWKAITDFGKLLDPVADKILVMAALVMLLAQVDPRTGAPWVPGWLVVLVLARETWVTGLRLVAVRDGIVVPADTLGKLKSAFQMVAVVALLLHDTQVFMLPVTFQLIGVLLLCISVIFSYVGAVRYTKLILAP